MKKLAATYGAPREVNPEEFLLELVSLSAGHVWWLREIITGLDPDALIYGEKQTTHQKGKGPEGPVDMTTTVHGAAVSEWVSMYLAEREHGRKAATDAIKANISERRIQLAEQFGERAGQWLVACTAALDPTPEQVRQMLAVGVQNLYLLVGTA